MKKPKTKPIIAVDIDDVLCGQNEAIMRFVNEKYGLNLTLEDYSIEGEYWGYWEKVWDVSPEEANKRLDAFHEAEGTMTQEPLDEVLEVLKDLKQRYDLIIVTARHDKQTEVTHKWLKRHFPKTFKGVHFVQIWHGNIQMTKAQVCKEVGAGYLIDDNLEHCTLAAESGVHALLFGEYGWNKSGELPNGITRVKDWRAVKEYFDETAR